MFRPLSRIKCLFHSLNLLMTTPIARKRMTTKQKKTKRRQKRTMKRTRMERDPPKSAQGRVQLEPRSVGKRTTER
jgi:hypothetical protein